MSLHTEMRVSPGTSLTRAGVAPIARRGRASVSPSSVQAPAVPTLRGSETNPLQLRGLVRRLVAVKLLLALALDVDSRFNRFIQSGAVSLGALGTYKLLEREE